MIQCVSQLDSKSIMPSSFFRREKTVVERQWCRQQCSVFGVWCDLCVMMKNHLLIKNWRKWAMKWMQLTAQIKWYAAHEWWTTLRAYHVEKWFVDKLNILPRVRCELCVYTEYSVDVFISLSAHLSSQNTSRLPVMDWDKNLFPFALLSRSRFRSHTRAKYVICVPCDFLTSYAI